MCIRDRGADARIGRDEGGVERTFGKDGAEMVGQPERNEKRVGHRAGAEDRRQHDVADKTGQPRDEGIAANSKDAPDHCCPEPKSAASGYYASRRLSARARGEPRR